MFRTRTIVELVSRTEAPDRLVSDDVISWFRVPEHLYDASADV